MTIGGRVSTRRPFLRRGRRPLALAQRLRLAQVVEEQVDRRLGELAGPVARRSVERDVHALEAVALELVAQQVAQRLVEVRQHRVQRHVDGQHVGHPNRSTALAV